ncbi:hypothetical protein PIB30_075408 [Stylosanthes scabra]|uniref:Uncharacterized protein n=1 Tax=Stylosanthes scabra TaxID=79078 RepID=A0ABU6RQE2_9FABA|nr:hypothetical protein [Stylosanthes scabra]
MREPLLWSSVECGGWGDVRRDGDFQQFATAPARWLWGLVGLRVRFARGDEADIGKAWEIRAAKRHQGMMHNIREKGAPHHWIPDDIFRRYLDYWDSADYQAKRRANKFNRASSTGESLHTGGRPVILPLQRRWRQSLGTYLRRVRYLYGPTPGKRIAEQHKGEIKRLEDERAARIAACKPAGPPIDEDEVWDRIAEARVGLRKGEIQQQAEAYKQEMEAWKRRYETDVTRFQTSLDTQTAEFDQWKSTVSQMYSFMTQMQGSSSSSMPPPPPPPPSSAPRPPRPPLVVTAGAPTATD